LFLPPLLMDGAWFTAVAPFRRHTAGILSLAVGAVLFTTAVVAIVTRLLMPQLPWPPASRLARSCRRPMPYPPAPCCSGSSCHAG
jgi:NhaP-type Na+/H+ or K+/H+ antiporter